MSYGWLQRRILLGMVAGLLFGVIISEATYYFLQNGENRPPQVVELTIPLGTAEKVRVGQSETSLPDSMSFVIGDTLLVNNQDTVTHQLGPLLIPAGSSARLELKAAEKYAAACTFEPGRYFGLDVQAPLTLETRLTGILEAGIPMGFLFVLYGVFAIPQKKVASR